MGKKITLGQLGLYNPQRVDDEIIKAIFVARKKEFDSIINSLQREDDRSIPQHHLVIAQRGMGKTTLLKRIEVELRQPDLKKRFVPLLFPEEQYNVKDLAEFWLNSLDALADTLEIEHNKCLSGVIDDKVKKIMLLRDENEIAKAAYEVLQNIGKEIGRRPVLLIDNINSIFSRLTDSEQHILRAWLTQNGVPIIIGASTTTFEQTINYEAPFYDAFQMHYLRRLTFDEVFQILMNLAEITDSKDIVPSIFEEIGRLKTLHQLTGGNPRTTVMLFKLIVRGFSKNINDDLEALLDEVTPIYKARFEELPEQPQVIIDAVALNWDPVTLEQLRDITRYGNNVLSPQLKRLVDAGWVDRIDAYNTKGGAYQICERFFNIWFLMRRSSRRKKKEIYCLAKFLECFYGEDLVKIARKHLNSLYTNSDHIAYGLALAEAIKDKELQQKLKEKNYQEIYSLSQEDPEILNRFNIPEKYIEWEKFRRLFDKYSTEKDDNTEEKIRLLHEMLDIDIDNAVIESRVYGRLGIEYAVLGQYQEAENAFKKSIDLDDKSPNSWFWLARLYHFNTHREKEAEALYKKAIAINGKDADYWKHLGRLYDSLKEFDKAVDALKKANKLDKDDAEVWTMLAGIYYDHEKGKEAENAFKRALKLNDADANSWFGLGMIYWDLFDDEKKAEKAIERALLLDYNNVGFLGVQGGIKKQLEKYQEAVELFEKALKIDENNTFLISELVKVYAYNLNEEKKAISVLKSFLQHQKDNWELLTLLGELYIMNENYDDAKRVISEVLKSDPNNYEAWKLLGVIYHEGFQDPIQAEKAYQTAIDLNKEDDIAYHMLANLYQDYLKKYKEAEELLSLIITKNNKNYIAYSELGRLYVKSEQYDKAEQAYLVSSRLNPNDWGTWFGLAVLYQDYLHDYKKAIYAYEKAYEVNDKEICVKVNLVFLYRDQLNQLEKARLIFDSIESWDDYQDSYKLNKALFDLYERNDGYAEKSIKEALTMIQNAFPKETQDDWWRFAAVVLKLDKGEWLCNILEEEGKNVELAPYYNALKALASSNPKAYLNSKAIEMQNAANEVISRICVYC